MSREQQDNTCGVHGVSLHGPPVGLLCSTPDRADRGSPDTDASMERWLGSSPPRACGRLPQADGCSPAPGSRNNAGLWGARPAWGTVTAIERRIVQPPGHRPWRRLSLPARRGVARRTGRAPAGQRIPPLSCRRGRRSDAARCRWMHRANNVLKTLPAWSSAMVPRFISARARIVGRMTMRARGSACTALHGAHAADPAVASARKDGAAPGAGSAPEVRTVASPAWTGPVAGRAIACIFSRPCRRGRG
jgi:hypothetical protein